MSLPNDTNTEVAELDTLTELLKDEEEATPEEEITEEEPEDKEEKEEDKEEAEGEEKEEKEIKIVGEEDEELVELKVPVSKKKILAKYPNLFKDFPYLETAYYADQSYKEIFPTLEDAKEAQERAGILSNFESNLLSGDSTKLLQSVREADPNAFNKIVDNYLPTLAKVDQNAFNHVVGNVVKNTIVAMAQEARNSNNEDLNKAAILLNQFVFGTSNFKPPTNLAKTEVDGEKSEVNKERQQFYAERFNIARDDLSGKLQNTLRATIDLNIDPKNAMPQYIKKHATSDTMDLLDKAIKGDKQFYVMYDKLWEQALKQNFSRESVNMIRSAYLAKAKTVLPQIIGKVRNDALRGLSKRAQSTEKQETNKKGPLPVGESRKSTGKLEIPKGMKTLDYLMKD